MNKRKLFGTILGIIFWSVCVVFFTFAYYEWRSTNTSIVIGINDLSTKCMPGTDVNVENIGPVLNYEDGVISEFSIENGINKEMAIDLRLDITSISDNLLVDSFKYAVVTDTAGGTNYDYTNPVVEGNFENFKIGSNIITTALSIVPADNETITQYFQFVVYIDGNMKNDINMQNNSLVANLMIGNCEENATFMDELIYQAIYSETDNSITFIHNKSVTVGDTYNDKVVTTIYTGFENAKYTRASNVPWYTDGNYANITTVTFEEVVSPVSTAYWFNGFSNLTSINIEKLDTSYVTDMTSMFSGCSSLVSLNVGGFDVTNVVNFSNMFSGCSNLTSLDLSGFKPNGITGMAGMFNDCNQLTELDLSGFSQNSSKDMSWLFYGCNSLKKLDISNLETSSATSMVNMFYNCYSLTSLDLSSFDTSNVTSMDFMFRHCNSLINLDLSNFDTSNVTSMASIFDGCWSLTELDVSNFDTSNVTNGMNELFRNCNSLISLDLSSWDTGNVTSMGGMFHNCNSLVSLDLSNFNTSKVTTMSQMFYQCGSLISLDVSSFDTSNVTKLELMFFGCSNLESLDLSNFDTSKITSMRQMFYQCGSLISLDISSFDTSNVTNLELMFYGCSSLISLDLSEFDISQVTTMYRMFTGCSNLTNLSLFDFNPSSSLEANEMFRNCSKLVTEIKIMNNNITNYSRIFTDAATAEGASIKLYYVGDDPTTTDVDESTNGLVESMKTSSTGASKFVDGGCIGNYCSV